MKSRRRAAGRGNPLLVAEQLNLLDVVSRGTAIMALAAGGDAMEFVGLGRGQRVAVASGARAEEVEAAAACTQACLLLCSADRYSGESFGLQFWRRASQRCRCDRPSVGLTMIKHHHHWGAAGLLLRDVVLTLSDVTFVAAACRRPTGERYDRRNSSH